MCRLRINKFTYNNFYYYLCLNPTNMKAEKPVRKNPRASFHDYSGGDYFITICIKNMHCLFGKIYDYKIEYSPLGKFCCQCIENLEKKFSYIQVPMYIVMPNHVHLILCINGNKVTEMKRSALSIVIGTLKRHVTLFAKENRIIFKWQGRYYDHIIRNTNDGNKIAQYIESNVERWHSDCFYPKNLIVYR